MIFHLSVAYFCLVNLVLSISFCQLIVINFVLMFLLSLFQYCVISWSGANLVVKCHIEANFNILLSVCACITIILELTSSAEEPSEPAVIVIIRHKMSNSHFVQRVMSQNGMGVVEADMRI
jgi:hypothetical protein